MRHRTLVLVLTGIVVGGCGESPTDPNLGQPEFAKVLPPESGVIISNMLGAVTTSSDLIAEITLDGRLFVNTEGTKKVPGQEICVDLSQLYDVLDQDTYDLFDSIVTADPTSNGMGEACTVVTMHTRDHSNEGKLGGQDVPSIEHSGGKIVLKDFATGRDTWEWRLIWDAVPDYADPDATDLGQGVCIDHPDNDTWYVYNDDDVEGDLYDSCAARGLEIDNIVELWRFYSERPNAMQFVHVAEFVMPFRFTVTRQ